MTDTDYEKETKHPYESDTVQNEVEVHRTEAIKRKAMFMGKWFTGLFWLVILINGMDIMTSDIIAERFPTLALLCTIGCIICNIAYGAIFWIMKAEEHRYQTVAYCIWAGVLLTFINDWMNTLSIAQREEGIMLFLAAVVMITLLPVSLYGRYTMYMGHAAVLQTVDDGLAEKWRTLWNYYIRLLFGILVGFLFMTLFSFLGFIGALVIIGGFIGLFVILVLEMVYLYQTAKFFQKHCE